MAAQRADVVNGDGFDVVAKYSPVISWEALGFALPPAPKSVRTAVRLSNDSLPLRWVLDSPGKSDPPAVRYRFPAPLDSYIGEARSVRSEVKLVEKRVLEGASGFVEVDPRSVTMGVSDLDKSIQETEFLDSAKFPMVRFTIESISSTPRTVSFGELTAAQVQGRFELKGVTVPIFFVAEVEPVAGHDGQPRVWVRGSFQINLIDFQVQRADGPAPANHTLIFDIHLKLKPARKD